MTQDRPTSLVDLLGEAADLPPPMREAFIRQSCKDPATLAEALSLLHAMERAGGFMGRSGQPTVADNEERPGRTIGPYRLIEQIGEGGFGVVFAAEQREPIQRRVALKIIKPGMDSRAVVARFEQERQALALMDHPGIARVFDAGTTPGGRPYFAMEYIKGQPITHYCDEHRLSVRDRLALFAQVCDAVQHAHTKGVIHRDLKPANILVTNAENSPPRPVVIDFGVAKAISLRLTDKTLFTEQGLLLGTPEYMSPEQADLAESQIDTRTDIYALGVVLYELLTGALPFDPRSLRAAGYAAIQRIIREEEPPRPSTRLASLGAEGTRVAQARRVSPQELTSDLRAELEWIPLRAMRKVRAERYRSAAELADDIANYLAHRPLLAGPESASYRAKKFVRRNRVSVAAGGLVLAALLIGAGGTTYGLFRARAEAAEARASEAAASAVNELMTTTVNRANSTREGGREDITVREVMDAAAEDLLAHPRTRDARVEMALSRTIGETYRELGLYEKALRMYEVHESRAREVEGAGSIAYARAVAELGQALKQVGQLDEADAKYAQARADLEAAGAAAAGELAVLRQSLAAIAADRGDTATANDELAKSAAYFETHGLTETREYCTSLRNRAVVAMQDGKADVAGPLLEKLNAIEARVFPDSAERLETMHGMVAVQRATNDPRALATLEETIATARRILGADHPDLAGFLHSLCILRMERQDFEGAQAAESEALAIYRARLSATHPQVATALHT
ncbi:MAG TPA: serine/threonine-protein kinase, partial [Phycisphaerales bacterium]|nr:serine/threonine-protein kinase [Phycisphaerales bacterium]